MPLPSILAAKLSKRGILNGNTFKFREKEKKRDFKGVVGCPNKNNIYHECNQWCEIHWKGVTIPDPKYLRNIMKLTQKYPLPHNWMEVFDKGIGAFYYWNMENDLVSWLPPKHPKAVCMESAAKVREKRSGGPMEEERFVFRIEDEKDSDKNRRSKDERKDRSKDSKDQDSVSEKRHRYDNKDRSRKRSRRDDIIDPMDPASYSDVPPGSWSDGLESNKAGVDSTASGALYQQRPYPAPGEVLSSNKSQKSKKNLNFGGISYA